MRRYSFVHSFAWLVLLLNCEGLGHAVRPRHRLSDDLSNYTCTWRLHRIHSAEPSGNHVGKDGVPWGTTAVESPGHCDWGMGSAGIVDAGGLLVIMFQHIVNAADILTISELNTTESQNPETQSMLYWG